MDWKPTTNPKTRQLRAEMLRQTRNFFFQRNVLEVETPALSQAANTDPYINSIESIQSTNQKRYLHTSPEYPMKRLLAAGSGDIYQICKVWREDEAGRNHNPEFTLLEWYRIGFDVPTLIQEVSDLLHTLLPNITQTDRITTYQQLFLEKFNLNPHIASIDTLRRCVKSTIANLSILDLSRQDLLDALLTQGIEPDFSNKYFTFITDYPASQSALAKIKQTKGKPDVAMRFEVYLGQSELGNGYQEETDYQRNKTILCTENNQRRETGKKEVEQDERFLSAAKSGIPESAGVAMGLDRILMLKADVDSIQKVINFPWDVA